jgi:hypothetical protein
MLSAFISAFISRDGLYLAFSLYLWKLIIDLPVLTSTTGFFRSYRLAWLIPVLEILNSVYTVYVGFAGNLKSVTWKGRKSGRKYQEKLK